MSTVYSFTTQPVFMSHPQGKKQLQAAGTGLTCACDHSAITPIQTTSFEVTAATWGQNFKLWAPAV